MKVWRPRSYDEMNAFCDTWCARCEQAENKIVAFRHCLCREAFRAMHFLEPPGIEWITIGNAGPECARLKERKDEQDYRD